LAQLGTKLKTLNGVFFLFFFLGNFGFLILYIFFTKFDLKYFLLINCHFGYITKIGNPKKKKKPLDTTDHPTSIPTPSPPTPPKCMHATNRPYHIFTFLGTFAAAFSSTMHMRNFFKCKDHLHPTHRLLTNL